MSFQPQSFIFAKLAPPVTTATAGARLIRPRQSSSISTAATLCGVIAILYFARDILIPLALAITLALIFSAPVAWLERLHIPRFAAALLVITAAISITGGIAYVIANELVGVVNELPEYSQNIDNKLTALRAPREGGLSKAAENVKQPVMS